MPNKRKTPSKITSELLRQHLLYDPDSGVFIRLLDSSRKGKAGDVAGALHKNGYLIIGVCGEKHGAHVLAWLYMTGQWPNATVDHEDRNRLNNRWTNLRPATQQEQTFNRTAWTRKKGTKLVGVYTQKGKWKAGIRLDGKYYHLGTYATDAEAHTAYLTAKMQMHKFSASGKPN